ncbi:hypothetical protein SAMN04488116_0279 [Flagellimonas flava]|uniref:Uncharacterized protein n=1 Tax=Flagellimonas flava TaxID=570519 RepID=A0A1M5HXT9_9FLAO|nr:hypothetical protein SAMN04488116_0279 [Allomuricauda flava]
MSTNRLRLSSLVFNFMNAYRPEQLRRIDLFKREFWSTQNSFWIQESIKYFSNKYSWIGILVFIILSNTCEIQG